MKKESMTIGKVACATGLASRLKSLPGIQEATIELTEETKMESILKAIFDYGFNGKMKR